MQKNIGPCKMCSLYKESDEMKYKYGDKFKAKNHPEFDINKLVDEFQVQMDSPSLKLSEKDEDKKSYDPSELYHKLILSKNDALSIFRKDEEKCKLIADQIQDDHFLSCYMQDSKIFLEKPEGCKFSKDVFGLKLGEKQPDEGNEGVMIPLGRSVDHRDIGNEQNLFFSNKLASGSWFFSKEGAFVFNNLVNMLKEQYRYRGFDEVISPNLYNLNIFKISGHYQNYKENMFMLKDHHEGLALKPMNCPGHYMIFKSRLRSYRDLPLRFAEFGVLHRNELSGNLSGLSRCRRFHVDDCHIFCEESQIHSEIMNNLNFVKDVYKLFGFEFKLLFSSRPEKSLGDDELWNKAEDQLKRALKEFGAEWEENPGDGAFYGPKIDIVLYDSMKKPHQ
jgi:threonyl-tRNA synthetase